MWRQEAGTATVSTSSLLARQLKVIIELLTRLSPLSLHPSIRPFLLDRRKNGWVKAWNIDIKLSRIK